MRWRRVEGLYDAQKGALKHDDCKQTSPVCYQAADQNFAASLLLKVFTATRPKDLRGAVSKIGV